MSTAGCGDPDGCPVPAPCDVDLQRLSSVVVAVGTPLRRGHKSRFGAQDPVPANPGLAPVRRMSRLLEGRHYEVLAGLSVDAHQLEELRDKVFGGVELTAPDQEQVRDEEDRARRREREALVWVARLPALLTDESMTLKAHHHHLETLLNRQIAFWIRTYVVAQRSLAQALTLRLHRAALSVPEECGQGWAYRHAYVRQPARRRWRR